MARVLFLDIETKPLEVFVWSPWGQNVGKNQVKRDWTILSWAARWQGSKKIYYADQSSSKNLMKDKKILKKIRDLISEADIIIGHNIDKFDLKKLNARFVINKMKRPRECQTIDTLKLAKKYFGFTYNNLDYLADILGVAKKDKHEEFPGMDLWTACMAGNKRAWRAMKKYNCQDVITLERVYERLMPYAKVTNYMIYEEQPSGKCDCGGKLIKNGFRFKGFGKYKRYVCNQCGGEARGRENLFGKEKKRSIKL